MSYLDKAGLQYLWTKITNLVSTKVSKVAGKGLSSNDYTTEEKNKLANLSNITIDTSLSETSTNPVQNKIITEALNQKANTSDNVSIDKLVAGTENSKIPSSLLPSYVDDVVEYNNKNSFPTYGSTGKIYVDKETNLTYRWSGSEYIEISPSLALGNTSSTAYRGDRGETAYNHANAKGSAFSSGLYKITTNAQGHVTGAIAVQKSDLTALNMLANDSTIDCGTWS